MTTVSKKILVVDDEKSLREIMKIMLVQIGYDPEFAENGEEALTGFFVSRSNLMC